MPCVRISRSFFAERGVGGRDEAGVAERAEVLAREKREAADRADRADRLAVILAADGLRGVFDHRDAALVAGLDQIGAMLRGLAEQVHGDDRLGARRDRGNRRRRRRC